MSHQARPSSKNFLVSFHKRPMRINLQESLQEVSPWPLRMTSGPLKLPELTTAPNLAKQMDAVRSFWDPDVPWLPMRAHMDSLERAPKIPKLGASDCFGSDSDW